MINGRDLILSINGTAVAASKSCKLDVQQNFIASCAPTSGRVKNKIPTDYTWSVSTECLIANIDYADNILSTLIAGTAVVIRFYDPQLRMHRTGSAYISSVSVGASIGSISTLSVAFEGSGELVSGEEWQNISAQCTFDASSLNPQPEGQQSIEHAAGGILITQDLTDTDLVWALLQNNNNVELKYFEFWNDREVLPQQATYIHTQTDNRMKKIFIADEFDYGYKIIIPDIESGYKIKIVFDTLSSTINEVNMKVTIYKRLIK